MRFHSNDHAAAHVERAVHFTGFNAANGLQPFEFGMRRKRGINVPAEAAMQAQQVGQPTASDVADAMQITD